MTFGYRLAFRSGHTHAAAAGAGVPADFFRTFLASAVVCALTVPVLVRARQGLEQYGEAKGCLQTMFSVVVGEARGFIGFVAVCVRVGAEFWSPRGAV